MAVDAVEEQSDAAVDVIRRGLADAEVVGLYLYGSAVAGGLRPDSDLDLFVVTDRRLTADEKARIVEGLLPISGRKTRPPDMAADRGDDRRPARGPSLALPAADGAPVRRVAA